jgi:glycosyltransferase involved in cell wall biosynthesis
MPAQSALPARAIVVIPTYNERESLPQLVEKIRSLAIPVDMLIVDDNSPDGTGQVADELAAAGGNRLLVLHREKKEGLGRAYLAGFRQALELRPGARLPLHRRHTRGELGLQTPAPEQGRD